MSHRHSPPAASLWSPDEPRARRSLMLCALGAILGLVIAGIGLFTAKGTRTSTVPAEDVALVNQVPILMSDYLVQLRALYDVSLGEATAQQKKKVLEDMIHEELYVQRGVELGLQSDVIEVRTALMGAVEAQVAADATVAQPGEADLRAYYDRHAGQYAGEGVLAVDDYLLGPGARLPAAAISAVLRERPATDPAALGLVRSGAMQDGEEFYFAAQIHLGPALFAAARRLRAGDVSEPFAAPDGIHVLRVRKNVVPVPRSYPDARGAVLQDYIAEQTKILTTGNDRFLRQRADIAVAKGFE